MPEKKFYPSLLGRGSSSWRRLKGNVTPVTRPRKETLTRKVRCKKRRDSGRNRHRDPRHDKESLVGQGI